MKHIPTPYHLKMSDWGSLDILDNQGIRIAKMQIGPDRPAQANGEFIVRCVNAHDELVEELRYTIGVLKEMRSYGSLTPAAYKAIECGEAVLAKAKGEA